MKWAAKLLTLLRHLLYLLFLYFKRGALKSFFYILTLLLASLVVGFLLESNAKMDAVVGQLNAVLPANRLKVVIPQKIEQVKKESLFSLFSSPSSLVRKKNFIKPAMMQAVKKIPGVQSVIPLINVDFPMGVEFMVPGSSGAFRAEVIGIGIHEKDAKPYLAPRENFKPGDQEVPILLASYILEVFNVILQNNAVPFKLTEKSVLGMKFSLSVGQSYFPSGAQSSVNERILCRVAGFIDMDYTYGIAFPSVFIEKYKKKFWQNFQPGDADNLMLTLSMDDFEKTEKRLKSLGFSVQEDTGLFKKISRFVNENKRMVTLFLGFISAVILALGTLLCLYTVSFMLKDRGLEFSLYRFFGSSNLKIFFLYGFYLSLLNGIALLASYEILLQIFKKLGTALLVFKDQIPSGFHSLLDPDFLLKPIFLAKFFSGAMILLEILLGVLLSFYLAGLKKRL